MKLVLNNLQFVNGIQVGDYLRSKHKKNSAGTNFKEI